MLVVAVVAIAEFSAGQPRVEALTVLLEAVGLFAVAAPSVMPVAAQ